MYQEIKALINTYVSEVINPIVFNDNNTNPNTTIYTSLEINYVYRYRYIMKPRQAVC
jgi:hypothetical protein